MTDTASAASPSPSSLPPTSLSVGEAVPDFDLPASIGRRASLSGLRGRPFVLYFYPKADTSGCTQEAQAFQEALDASGPDTVPVIGVSKDPIGAIDRFAAKYDLRFPLASDEAGTLLEACGVWVQKSMYGRSYMGIERSTCLIDAGGRVARLWRKVKMPGHVAEVMRAAVELR